MLRVSIRLFVACTIILAVTLGGVTGTVAAGDEDACTTACLKDPGTDTPEVTTPEDGDQISVGDNKVAATRVRKAFLTAKKAFHEARQEIQAIKKGDESPVKDVPTFFDSDEETDDEETDDGSE